MPPRETPLIERFYAKVDRSGGPTACWPWLGARQKSRGGGERGRIREGGRGTKIWHAHRLALALSTGADRPALEAMHTCDTPLCCNPAHLLWGTHPQNMRDYARKYGGIFRPKSARRADIPELLE